MVYNVDLQTFARKLLPPVLRTPTMLALLKVVVSPLGVIYALFLIYRQDTKDIVTAAGNVIAFEHYLNALFRFPGKKIHITTPDLEMENIMTLRAEKMPPITLRYISEQGEKHFFYQPDEVPPQPTIIVNYPDILNDSERLLLRKAVEQYKPVGRQFDLKKYDYE